MGQMAATIRIVVWSCVVLWTLGRAVPSDNASPNEQQVQLVTSRNPYVQLGVQESATSISTSPFSVSGNQSSLQSSASGNQSSLQSLAPGNQSSAPGNPSSAPGDQSSAPGNPSSAPGDQSSAPGNQSSAPSSASGNQSSAALDEAMHVDPKKLAKLLAVESSTESLCSPTICDAQSTLLVTVDPVGNKTGYVSRALGLPVSLHCTLLTQGRHVSLPVVWRLPNATELLADRVQILSVDLTDSGEYTCQLAPHDCCANVRPDRIHLRVYELSETAGILLMLSVLTSIVILVGVFIYSQKKKKYHSWLKHEILAASNGSGDSTPRSTLNRDMQTNSKKYLLNT